MFQEITIQFTEQCNISCFYCFAPTKSEKILSKPDFDVFLEFCKHEHIEVIHITGGEPTLNPRFSEFVRELATMSSLVIYTNFTTENVVGELHVADPSEIIFLVNMTSRLFCSESQRKTIQKNIQQALEKGFRVALSHTFFDPAVSIDDQFEYLIKKMKEYRLRNLRISQALSFGSNQNFYNRTEIESLYHYVAQRISIWREDGLAVYFDCPVPPCFINPSDFNILRQNNAVSIKCIPKIFVMWNLDVTHCYSTMDKTDKRKLYSFQNLSAAKEYSTGILRKIQEESNRTGCYRCRYGKDGIPCGCPSYCV